MSQNYRQHALSLLCSSLHRLVNITVILEERKREKNRDLNIRRHNYLNRMENY